MKRLLKNNDDLWNLQLSPFIQGSSEGIWQTSAVKSAALEIRLAGIPTFIYTARYISGGGGSVGVTWECFNQDESDPVTIYGAAPFGSVPPADEKTNMDKL